MEAGRLRNRVEVQIAQEAQDSHGGIERTWTTEQKRWAAIEPLQGRELFLAQQVAAQVDVRLRLRHYAGLTSAHRIVKGDDIYNIKAVINVDEKNAETIALCVREA